MSREDLVAALPKHLRQQADITGSGELLWPYAPAADAVRGLGDAGVAILAVEVYGRLALARGNFYGDWPLGPGWQSDESWDDYVQRTCTLALDAIRDDRETSEGEDADADDRRYFLAVSRESAYPDSLRAEGP